MTGLAGAIEWGALNGAASLSATGIWRGESFSIDASSAKPLILFAGGSAPVSIDVKAAPASGSFDGVANFSQNSFFDGQLAFNSPSLRRMLEWSRTDLAAQRLDRLGRAVGQDHRRPQAAQVRQCRGHARRQSGSRRARPVAR